MKHVIVGTAGHIDHGKSALVEALTGTHPDRLEEEKRRGITIDLGFAFLELDEARIGFVDVPGHEKFVRNMLAGAGGIDLVLLVVAADESIKPQTREHFDICRLLGIPRGLVAITKSDLAGAEARGLVRLEVEEFVRGSFLESSPILEVSARTGEGLEKLKQELRRLSLETPAKDATGHFRLPIDRAFAMKGFGPVVTGTLVSGLVKREDEVELFPAGKVVRVRGVHSGGRPVECAVAGQRTAINLAGVELGELRRGMVLAAPGRFEATNRADAKVSLLGSARPLKNHSKVHFHQGTAARVAEIVLLGRGVLSPGGAAFAQLRLDEPAFLLPLDRFILRQFSPVVTIAGGVVFDAHPRVHRHDDPEASKFLEILEAGKREEVLEAHAERTAGGMDLAQIVARTGWLEAEVWPTARELAEQKRLRIVSEQPLVVATEGALAEFCSALRAEVDRFHRLNPLLPGIPKEELRSRVGMKVRSEVFRGALEELASASEIVVSGDLVSRAGREIVLLPEELKAKEQIEQEFARAGLKVPYVAEVLAKVPVETSRAQRILQILLREKVLIKVSEDLIFHRGAVAQLKELLAGYKQRRGERMPVAAFKDLTGVSRKYAIPLLEFLDRQRLTRRVGDERVIL